MKARHFILPLSAALLFAGAAMMKPAATTMNVVKTAKFRSPETMPPCESLPILAMGPDEWRARFEGMRPSVTGQTRQNIIHLSDGLQKSLAAGVEPGSEEAQVYVDAIQALLDYKEP